MHAYFHMVDAPEFDRFSFSLPPGAFSFLGAGFNHAIAGVIDPAVPGYGAVFPPAGVAGRMRIRIVIKPGVGVEGAATLPIKRNHLKGTYATAIADISQLGGGIFF